MVKNLPVSYYPKVGRVDTLSQTSPTLRVPTCPVAIFYDLDCIILKHNRRLYISHQANGSTLHVWHILCSYNQTLNTKYFILTGKIFTKARKEKNSNHKFFTANTAITLADSSLDKTLKSTSCQVPLSGVSRIYGFFANLPCSKSFPSSPT